jgi:hypothetical protein
MIHERAGNTYCLYIVAAIRDDECLPHFHVQAWISDSLSLKPHGEVEMAAEHEHFKCHI